MATVFPASAFGFIGFPEITIEIEEGSFTGYSVVVGKSHGYGGWFSITDSAVASEPRFEVAVAQRPGLVHHSDRGVQYACGDYTGLLKEHEITISMSRKGNPYDNAACESFMKTLKYEEVYRQEYRGMAEALASIGEFINRIYNQKRLHSALAYRPPEESERIQANVAKK